MRRPSIGRRNAAAGAVDHQAPLRRRTLACVDGAILQQESEYPVAPPARVTLGRDTGVVPPRVLQQRSQQRRLSPIQLRCLLAKVMLRGSFGAENAVSPFRRVEINLQYFVFREHLLN